MPATPARCLSLALRRKRILQISQCCAKKNYPCCLFSLLFFVRTAVIRSHTPPRISRVRPQARARRPTFGAWMGGEKKKAARPLLKIRREISEPSDEFRFFLVFGQRGMQQVGEHGSEIARDIIGLHEALPADILEQGVLLRLHLHSLVRYSCSAFCRWFFFTVGGGRARCLWQNSFSSASSGVVVWWRGGGGAGRGRTDLPSHNTRKKEIRTGGGAGWEP